MDHNANDHGPRRNGKEIEVRGGGDGEKLPSEDLGHHEKEFEKGQQSEKDRGEKEEVFGREVDLSDIFCRKLIETRQDEESQKADANQDGDKITAFLGLSKGLDLEEIFFLDAVSCPDDHLSPLDLEIDGIGPFSCDSFSSPPFRPC